MKLRILVVVAASLWTSCTVAQAQNWRTPNPNQPNGYRATEAAYHFHGSYKEPSSASNGYRATEARSRAGMSCFAPPSSSQDNQGSRWGGAEERRWGNVAGSNFQNAPAMENRQEEWNEFYKRRFEATEQGGFNGTQQYASEQSAGGSIGTKFDGCGRPGASFGSAQAMRAVVGASAVRRMLRSGDGGSFNSLYNSNSGGFYRIYASE